MSFLSFSYYKYRSYLVIFTLLLNLPSSVIAEPQHNSPYKFMHLSINDGLSNNQVRAILRDSQGFMWFGTGRGLNRFDGINFKIFRHDINDVSSIPFNSIDELFEDAENKIWIKYLQQFTVYDPVKESFLPIGKFYKDTSIPLTSLRDLFIDHDKNTWFVTSSFGLYKYNIADGSVDSLEYIAGDTHVIANDYLNNLDQDSERNLWAVSNSGHIINVDYKTLQIVNDFQLEEEIKEETNNLKLFIDKDDCAWVFSPGQPHGAYRINPTNGTITHYSTSSENVRLNNNLVASIVQDDNGLIWIATDHGGINILNLEDNSIQYLLNNQDDEYSISQNSINYLYEDSENIIWAGTYKKGINYYHEDMIRFEHFNHQPSVPNSLPFDDVNCFVEDKTGNLWIGTNGGGLIYFDRQNHTFTSYRHDSNDSKTLSNNIIVSAFIDRNNQLWIGSYFGGLDRFDGKEFHHHRHNPDNPASLADDRVWEIFEDSKRNLWIGTLNGGLDLFDRERNIFYHYRAEDINSVGSNFIMSIIEDSKDNLWFGTADGLDRLDLATKRFYHYSPVPGVSGELSDRVAIDIHEDSRGYIWIATPEGLNVFDRNESQFKVFTETDGLADSNIKTILEDQQGNLWLGTTNGVMKVEIINRDNSLSLNELEIQVTNFDIMDGLQGKEFNEKAAYRTKSGELIFGGANGFNLFIPESIEEEKPENEIVLTNFKVFNQEVPVGTPFRNRIILDKSITQQQGITLRHNENVFSFSFAALNYFQPKKINFEYQLEGFNNEWLKTSSNNNEATFTNLNADEYLLRIRSTTDGHSWTEMQPPLKIIILPPFWKSKLAFTFYVIFILGILLISRRIMLERERLKFEATQEHREAERIQQLDALKTRFFTNISHEFRTPLSLILTPLEKLIVQIEDEKMKNQLIFIHRNARRLLSMVNQLLDFRKMEVQKLEAKRNWGDMVGFIREVALSFQDMAENKHIEFKITSSEKELYTFFDQDKTYKVISNLLSNAFKFTPEKGKIRLKLSLEKPMTDSAKNKTALIKWVVKDSGIGIPPDKQDKIFDRFYQDEMPGSIVNQGTGIGLSMVHEYVNVMGGDISVESIVGKGSSFIVSIPVELFSEEETKDNMLTDDKKIVVSSFTEIRPEDVIEKGYDTSKKTVLLVEDNDDFRFYLKDNLRSNYNIIETNNGLSGWESTLKEAPDLIVSDVVMPVMDGLELCSKIKSDSRTSHIPVILLTAKVETDDALEGFGSGADDYISKPFDFRILESRIENLIQTREQLRQTYQAMIGIHPEKIEVKSMDGKFIKKALEVVEKNIGNSDFSVEDLSRELGMSRVSLYKKLLSLTKKTPVEFIRIIRLKRAADLSENTQLSVSEIAYRVGFNSPRYFSKYFKEFYQVLPSTYIQEHRKKPDDYSSKI